MGFNSLEKLNLKSISSAPQALKCLGSEMQLKAYARSLRHLTINACILKEEKGDDLVIEHPSSE